VAAAAPTASQTAGHLLPRPPALPRRGAQALRLPAGQVPHRGSGGPAGLGVGRRGRAPPLAGAAAAAAPEPLGQNPGAVLARRPGQVAGPVRSGPRDPEGGRPLAHRRHAHALPQPLPPRHAPGRHAGPVPGGVLRRRRRRVRRAVGLRHRGQIQADEAFRGAVPPHLGHREVPAGPRHPRGGRRAGRVLPVSVGPGPEGRHRGLPGPPGGEPRLVREGVRDRRGGGADGAPPAPGPAAGRPGAGARSSRPSRTSRPHPRGRNQSP